MNNLKQRKQRISLKSYGIKHHDFHYQLTADELHEISLEKGMGQEASSGGALAIKTGEFTGRSPKDRFIVKDDITKDQVWWGGDINIPFSPEKFDTLYDKVIEYLNQKELFVRDCYACADHNYRMDIRVINEYPWSNMFAHNMFIRPTEEELKNFDPEWTVINAPVYGRCEVDGTRQHNFAILNFTKKIALIGGTGYTGEIKKGIFSALNFILPVEKNTLPMHCSANVGKKGDTAIFFGLSGTGKTTLSTDASRKLIGDDEHGWNNENAVFNFEGGCYARSLIYPKKTNLRFMVPLSEVLFWRMW